MSNNQNIMITGANGFIGSYLVHHLAKFDHFTIYPVDKYALYNITEKLQPIIADFTDKNFTESIPRDIDIIVHLAQSNKYRNFPDSVDDIFAINIHSTQQLLEWSRKIGVSKFIFASTGNVYKPQNKLLNESDLCEPDSYYGASKYAAEQLVKPYSQYFSTTILRLFGVYGPGQTNMIIPNLIECLRNQKEIILAKNIGHSFTPLYIDDCVEMIVKILKSNVHRKSIIYNIAGNEVINLFDLVTLKSEFLKVIPNFKVTEKKPVFLMGANNKFNKDFSYKPPTTLESGIKSLFEK